MPASSRFPIQVQTAFEEVMGGIADEKANNVCTGDKFLTPRASHFPNSWKQERQSCASIPESCSLDRNLGRKHASLSALRAESETSWFMCLEPCSGSHWHRHSANGPESQEGYLLTPCLTLHTPFPSESFFSKPETLIQTSESEISSSESNYRNLFQIKINLRQVRTSCPQVKSRYRKFTILYVPAQPW